MMRTPLTSKGCALKAASAASRTTTQATASAVARSTSLSRRASPKWSWSRVPPQVSQTRRVGRFAPPHWRQKRRSGAGLAGVAGCRAACSCMSKSNRLNLYSMRWLLEPVSNHRRRAQVGLSGLSASDPLPAVSRPAPRAPRRSWGPARSTDDTPRAPASDAPHPVQETCATRAKTYPAPSTASANNPQSIVLPVPLNKITAGNGKTVREAESVSEGGRPANG